MIRDLRPGLRWPRLALWALVLGACGDDGVTPRTPEEVEFAPELGVDLSEMTRTPEGLYLQDVVQGEGAEADLGDRITVHYTGWLADGTRFDTSRGGTAVTFDLAPGNLIDGWTVGVPGMRAGGTRRLVIPWELGYGPSGRGQIPPYAVLVFDVELLAVEGGGEAGEPTEPSG